MLELKVTRLKLRCIIDFTKKFHLKLRQNASEFVKFKRHFSIVSVFVGEFNKMGKKMTGVIHDMWS